MTPDERERYKELIEIFHDNDDLIELLDLDAKNYQDLILANIRCEREISTISAMQAGVNNLRNELSKILTDSDDKRRFITPMDEEDEYDYEEGRIEGTI